MIAGTLVRVKGCWNDEGLLKVAHLRESAACANPGFRPRIGVRGGLCVGMTKVQFMDNGKALPKRPYGHRAVGGWEKVFSKNLPLGPLGPPSKLWVARRSFELGGAFNKSFLPPLCPLGPRFDPFGAGSPCGLSARTFLSLSSLPPYQHDRPPTL